MLSRTIILVTCSLLLHLYAFSQHFAKKDFDIVSNAVGTEKTKSGLVKRLDALLKNYMPSRSGVGMPLNRKLEDDFYHQRIAVRFYPNNFCINLLTRNDSIFLSTIYFTDSPFAGMGGFTYADSTMREIRYNNAVMAVFLKTRNGFYHSAKTITEAAIELSGNEMYAMRCGDGLPFTEEGKRIRKLVEEEDPLPEIARMLQSLSCEVQAYGVTAIDMLLEKGVAIDNLNSKLYRHIVKRNAVVITCSGCLAGLTEKIYDKR
ncbi:hypothetical protein ACTJJ0_14855 [Chitinophaga sp. 22321]|uniref:Uncharacterized protein n=1 Tax=Chitinophaga hostae TaxID=2831022 RepID=A0ABS5J1W7_9BACT|nr:hypothetical protein [Chitinophaga hostae]MBS0029228.1 hypothetical protein [Chitinophaga hostae]